MPAASPSQYICTMIEDMDQLPFHQDGHRMSADCMTNGNFDIADFLENSTAVSSDADSIQNQCSASDSSCNRSNSRDGYPYFPEVSPRDYPDSGNDYHGDHVPYEHRMYTYPQCHKRQLGFSRDRQCQRSVHDRPMECNDYLTNQQIPHLKPKEEPPEYLRWTSKHPENWTPKEVLDWVFYAAEIHRLDCGHLHAENFRSISGAELCKMKLDDFLRLEQNYGKLFYDMFRNLCDGMYFSQPGDNQPNECLVLDDISLSPMPHSPRVPRHMNSDPGPIDQPYTSVPEIVCKDEMKMDTNSDQMIYDIQNIAKYNRQAMPMPSFFHASMSKPPFQSYDHMPPNYNYSDFNLMAPLPPPPCSIPDDHMVPQPVRRRPGRPRIKSLPTEEEAAREKKAKNQHLWEFIYEILMNPLYNPQYLRWENQREGVFRFVQSEAVAQLWGGIKNNENMTYEKLSRAMRHYYKRGILERVEGRRLVYKFSRAAMERVREKQYPICSR